MSASQTHKTGMCKVITPQIRQRLKRHDVETVVPVAFRCAAIIKKGGLPSGTSSEQLVRYGCRDVFRQKRILAKLIPTIEEILAAGGIEPPAPAEDQILPAIPNPEVTGDDGHRN